MSLAAPGLLRTAGEGRRLLLAELLRRGLPQNAHFEQAALATLLPERWPAPRARQAFAEWVAQTAAGATAGAAAGGGEGGPELEVERSPIPPHVLRRVVVRPLARPRPLPALAALFPPPPPPTPAAAAEGGESIIAGAFTTTSNPPAAAARPATAMTAHGSLSSSSSTASTASTGRSLSLHCARSPSPDAEGASGGDSGGEEQEQRAAAAAASVGAETTAPAPMAVCVGEARLHSVANGAGGGGGAAGPPLSQQQPPPQQDEDEFGRSPCSKRLASWPQRGGGEGASGGGTAPAPSGVQRGASDPF